MSDLPRHQRQHRQVRKGQVLRLALLAMLLLGLLAVSGCFNAAVACAEGCQQCRAGDCVDAQDAGIVGGTDAGTVGPVDAGSGTPTDGGSACGTSATSSCTTPGVCQEAEGARCVLGRCQYLSKRCDEPPANSCDGSDAIVYGTTSGSCDLVTDSCFYVPTVTSCGANTCDVQTGTCFDSCSLGGPECSDGFICSGQVCVLRVVGDLCTTNNECSAGLQCQAGVCCAQGEKCCQNNDDCGVCEQCGGERHCVVQAAGDDVKNECGEVSCSSGCDGAGSCVYASAGTSCNGCFLCDGAGICGAEPVPEQVTHECLVHDDCIPPNSGPERSCKIYRCLPDACGNRCGEQMVVGCVPLILQTTVCFAGECWSTEFADACDVGGSCPQTISVPVQENPCISHPVQCLQGIAADPDRCMFTANACFAGVDDCGQASTQAEADAFCQEGFDAWWDTEGKDQWAPNFECAQAWSCTGFNTSSPECSGDLGATLECCNSGERLSDCEACRNTKGCHATVDVNGNYECVATTIDNFNFQMACSDF